MTLLLNLAALLVLLRLRRKQAGARWLALAYGLLLAVEYLVRHATVDAVVTMAMFSTIIAYMYFTALNRLQGTRYFWGLLAVGYAFIASI